MARSEQEKADLCREFILAECPRWVLHPNVVRKLGFRSVTITPRVDDVYSRGNADHNGRVRISSHLDRFRHASPYTVPKGKADLSPVGVFAHEFGHIVDFAVHKKYGMKATSPTWDWLRIHRDLRRGGITTYARSYPSEDFAETHRLFVLNAKLLKVLSPERHAHMRHIYMMLLGTEHPHRMFAQSKHDFEKQFHKLLIME